MEIYLQMQTGRAPTVIDDFTSFRWRRKYYDVGEFELHVKNDPNLLYQATSGDVLYVWFKGSIERGIVESIVISRDEIAFSGRMESKNMVKTVAKKLIINSSAPAVMAQAYQQNGGSVSNSSTVTDNVNAQWRWNTLYDIEKSIGRAYNIGFYVRENTLYLYDGTDRSIAQNEINPVVFLDDDLDSPSLTLDNTNYYGFAYVAGEGEGDDRVFVTVGSGTDQLYVDARDLSQGEQTLEEYQAQLKQRGTDKLAETISVETFETSVSTGSRYKYGTDYFLGDIVTVQLENWRITQNFRITEVEEVWENGIYTVFPTFGDPLPEKLELKG